LPTNRELQANMRQASLKASNRPECRELKIHLIDVAVSAPATLIRLKSDVTG